LDDQKRPVGGIVVDEDLHSQLVECSPDPIVVLQDGLYKFVNSAFAQLFGYTQEDVAAGLTFYQLVAEPDKPAVQERYEARLRGEDLPQTFVINLLAKDGTSIYCETSAALIQHGGRPADLVIIRDIRERRQTDEDLATKKTILDTVMAYEQQLRRLDFDEVVKMTLEFVKDRLGVARTSIATVEGDRFRMWAVRSDAGDIPELKKGQHVQLADSAMSEAVQGRRLIYRPDIRAAGHRWKTDELLLSKGILCDALVPMYAADRCIGTLNCGGDRVDGISPDSRQIMELLAARLAHAMQNTMLLQKVRDSEAGFRALIEESQDIIYVTDARGIIKYASPSAEMIRGVPVQEFVGSNAFERLHVDDRDAIRAKFAQLLEKPGSQMWAEYRIIHPDGSPHIFEATGTNLLEDPRVNGIVVNARDITDRRRIEREMQKHERLESLGVLAGGLAHDFNNLLTAILGYVTLAKNSQPEDSSPAKYLQRAESAARQTVDLTRQLLTFARGGAPIKTKASIAEVVRESADFAVRGAGIRCEMDLPDDLWPLHADRGQLSQVVNNLVLNAVQAMGDGGIIHVRCRNLEPSPGAGNELFEGPALQLSITDTGGGIPEEHLAKIYDPYFSTKESGSGLGLAVVYTIVQRHEGDIRVESRPGQGSTFTITLPALADTAVSLEEAEPRPARTNGHILVMDDEDIVREVAMSILEELGHSTDGSPDGNHAIERYRLAMIAREPYDAVLMDLTVPGAMGGREATHRLLELDPDARVVVVSGYANDPVVANPEEYGFIDRLCKPFSVDELGEVIDRALKARD